MDKVDFKDILQEKDFSPVTCFEIYCFLQLKIKGESGLTVMAPFSFELK